MTSWWDRHEPSGASPLRKLGPGRRSCAADATGWVLRQAVAHLPSGAPAVAVVMDGGSENAPVEHANFADVLRCVRALVEVSYSNSLTENFRARLKHRWLCLHDLDRAETAERLVGKFVEDHNTMIPRAALGGPTPDEVYRGLETDLPKRLVGP